MYHENNRFEKSLAEPRNQPLMFTLGFYILFVGVVLSLLSPLRSTGEIEPGALLIYVLPPVLLLLCIFTGPFKVIKPVTYFQLVLIYAILSAAILGYENLFSENSRAFYSHIFQLGSAYLLLGVGWHSYNSIPDRFWAIYSYIICIAIFIATYFAVASYTAGDTGRLYTPAYYFILITSYGALHSRKLTLVSLFGLALSNKRGPIISVLILISIRIFSVVTSSRNAFSNSLKIIFISVFGGAFFLTGAPVFDAWAEETSNINNPVARAYTTTKYRVEGIFDQTDRANRTEELLSGRSEEIEAALETMDGFSDWIFGNGAGWGVYVGDEFYRFTQNIHITPFSLTASFGLPFAVLLYIFLLSLIVRGLRFVRFTYLPTTVRMAPLYLAGAMVHSLVAYSLFVDFLTFYFAGVILRQIAQLKNRSTRYV